MKRSVLKLTVIALTVAAFVWAAPRSSGVVAAGEEEDAAATYKSKCVMCHAPDGSGNTPVGKSMKLRDLGSADVQGQSDSQLYDVITKGKGKMPAYEKSLGEDTCKALVTHIRSFKK
ncbi:MAG: hypothetical protein DMF61_22075 [Blastocatellia bacterium AA13]|nr:MAG: hypothetical protein DMF61_22075 [Blastocatellia bacterium AA13]